MKKLNRLKLTYLFGLFFSLFFISQNLHSQSNGGGSYGFKIVNNSHSDKEAFYISSIQKADMEQYRLKDKEVTLQFENGFECVLLSAKQLFLVNSSTNPSLYQEDYPMDSYALPTFFITDSGQIKAKSTKTHKKGLSSN